MIRIALCEDNELQRQIMADYLEAYAADHMGLEFKLFGSGQELLDTVRETPFDIYILDIVMPGINGFETATTLRLMKDNGIIIFISATVDYALLAFDVRAFYYLMKPVDSQKLFRVLDMALAERKERNDSIVVKTANGDVVLPFSDIMYVELQNRALHFVLKNGISCDSQKLRGSFKDAVTAFSGLANFTAVGATRLVNMKCVASYDSESIVLRDGTMLYIPQSAYSEFRQAYRAFAGRFQQKD